MNVVKMSQSLQEKHLLKDLKECCFKCIKNVKWVLSKLHQRRKKLNSNVYTTLLYESLCISLYWFFFKKKSKLNVLLSYCDCHISLRLINLNLQYTYVSVLKCLKSENWVISTNFLILLFHYNSDL